MTNNELLHASLLDILFDGRNKDYGAYALRKTYDRRLTISLGVGLSLILLLVFVNRMGINDQSHSNPIKQDDPGIIIKPYTVDPPKPDLPIVKPAVQNPIKNMATVDYTTNLKITNDNLLKETEMPAKDDVEESVIGSENKDGERQKDVGNNTPTPVTSGNTGIAPVEPEVIKPSSSPEFPGGFEALRKFLAKNLNTPEELEVGETKTVKARFIVDKDGSVSTIEIMFSGGRDFDKEVVRVCKKMPKWKPAIQNGEPVTMSYILPVTFIGIE